MSLNRRDRVAVVGAGIVGLSVAHHLQKAGFQVTVVDAESPASQCSRGNAGALSGHSVAPLAMPGVLKGALRMILDKTGPLHIPPTYLPAAAPWLLRFVRAARPERVEAIAQALSGLLTPSLAAHTAMASDVGFQGIATTGQLHLYPDAAALSKDSQGWDLKKRHGLEIERLQDDEVQDLEPDVSRAYRIGLLLPQDRWVANPYTYGVAIAASLVRNGATFVRGHVRRLVPDGSGWRLDGPETPVHAEKVVVAGGAWSAALLSPLGIRVPLESQRGYHLHVPDSGTNLTRTVVLADRKVFITPMDDGLRIAGTVEFGGLARPMNEARAALLGEHAKIGLPGLRTSAQPGYWMGHRPCLPDSMPVLGPAAGHPGLWLAFGHGHLGLTGAATTGEWMAAAMRGDATALAKCATFSVSRFDRTAV